VIPESRHARLSRWKRERARHRLEEMLDAGIAARSFERVDIKPVIDAYPKAYPAKRHGPSVSGESMTPVRGSGGAG
jgi:hypothetical protein